jgi:hypothetical protein
MFTKEDKRLMTKVDQKFFTLDLNKQSEYLRDILFMLPIDYIDMINNDLDDELESEVR